MFYCYSSKKSRIAKERGSGRVDNNLDKLDGLFYVMLVIMTTIMMWCGSVGGLIWQWSFSKWDEWIYIHTYILHAFIKVPFCFMLFLEKSNKQPEKRVG